MNKSSEINNFINDIDSLIEETLSLSTTQDMIQSLIDIKDSIHDAILHLLKSSSTISIAKDLINAESIIHRSLTGLDNTTDYVESYYPSID